jgi:adenosylcobinamide kinase/adenosylcobinamide-phosphate guanylyltransferase
MLTNLVAIISHSESNGKAWFGTSIAKSGRLWYSNGAHHWGREGVCFLMDRLILVLGGARSGKSTYAQKLAGEIATGSGRVAYVATGVACDDEMRARVEQHQRSRPLEWATIEAPTEVAQAIKRVGEEYAVMIVDCLTVLITNWLADMGQLEDSTESMVNLACQRSSRTVRLGSPEPCSASGERETSPALGAAEGFATPEENSYGIELEKAVLGRVGELVRAARGARAVVIVVSNEVGLGVVPAFKAGRVFRDLAGLANQFIAREADEVYVMWAGVPQKIKGKHYG